MMQLIGWINDIGFGLNQPPWVPDPDRLKRRGYEMQSD
jgi:hypothetical protein